MIINIDNYAINYIDEGGGDAVLLLHGWGSNLKSFKSWANNSGKDKYNFCAIATGYVFATNIVNQLHTTDFWTSEFDDDNGNAKNFWFGENQSTIVQETNGYNNGFCIRLCKDV